MEFPNPKKQRDSSSLVLQQDGVEEETMPSSRIPEELYLEILIRLPVESILNCKSVCKSWLSLISNPSFAKFHVQQNENNSSGSSLLLELGEDRHGHLMHSIGYDSLESSLSSEEIEDCAVKMLFPFKFDIQFVRLFGSCNGLVFLWLYDDHRSHSDDYDYYDSDDYRDYTPTQPDGDTDSDSDSDDGEDEADFLCVWNPTTGEYKKIPSSPNTYLHRRVCIYGLGYDGKNDDYKCVIGVSSGKSVSSTLVEVYSLRSNSWKTIQTPYRFTYEDSGALVNGDLHWLAEGECGVSIVYLDSGSDTPSFKEIQLPGVPNLEFISVGVLEGGCLCVVADNGGPVSLGRVEVWVMQVYGVRESWTNHCVIMNHQ